MFVALCRLEAPFITFGGSIHHVWRLRSSRLDADRKSIIPGNDIICCLDGRGG